MSLYNDLNDVNVEVDEYEEIQLTEFEKKKWEKRILAKVKKQKNKQKKKAGAIALIVLTSITISTVTAAHVPYVAGLIEEYIGSHQEKDFTPYKTAIGETAENEYGKWTLNEVLVDSGRLLLSSTFEPNKGVKFDYQTHPTTTVRMNGVQLLPELHGGQTIKNSDSSFTVFNEIEFRDMPVGDQISFHIAYDHLHFDRPVETPWVFDINVPTEQLAINSQTIEIDYSIPLDNGHVVYVDKMITTPVSTILYFEWPEQEYHVGFTLTSESGEEVSWDTRSGNPESSFIRFHPLDDDAESYQLLPYIEMKPNYEIKELTEHIIEIRH
ncbi:DUF4179 domain-containing protein [Bacillus alkalicellulosilyticus]|uniref:DUF4179 domain-containing protein n=1 Tax=Alkalihalobacterium alkalicellulosilyticum TaxID=1912214 RepID=UPI00099838B7|nr:DUF4179 domain-containing protein [Bacillus alkalicellulosilyticus]